jgi:hypothetical protein
MAGVSGIEIRTAVAKANMWGTAVAVGVGDGIMTLPQTIKKDFSLDIDDSQGNAWVKDGTPGPIKAEGGIPGYLRYDSLDLLLAMFMGASAGAPAQQGATIAYAQILKWAEKLDGLFVTLAKDMKNYILEVPSLKITGITIKGEVGAKPLQITFDGIGINKIVDSDVNTLVSFSTDVTWPEVMNRVKFSEGIFRLNTQSGAALGEDDIIYPSSFELTAKRKMSGVYDGQYRTTGTSPQDLIDEPSNDGFPEASLKLEFPRHTSATYLTALNADTRMKMDMFFTGALIADPYYRQFGIQLPHLQLKNDDPTDEAGRIKEPLEFAVYGAVAAPEGMAGITDPFWISVINQQSQDMLA